MYKSDAKLLFKDFRQWQRRLNAFLTVKLWCDYAAGGQGERLCLGRLRRTDVGPAGGRPVQAVRRDQLGDRVCGEEPARGVHQDIQVRRLDRADHSVLVMYTAVQWCTWLYTCVHTAVKQCTILYTAVQLCTVMYSHGHSSTVVCTAVHYCTLIHHNSSQVDIYT